MVTRNCSALVVLHYMSDLICVNDRTVIIIIIIIIMQYGTSRSEVRVWWICGSDYSSVEEVAGLQLIVCDDSPSVSVALPAD